MTGRIKVIALVFVLIVIVASGIVWAAWDWFGIWITPRLILRSEIFELLSELDVRIENHPMKPIVKLVNEKGRYSADIELSIPELLWDISHVTGTVHMDLAHHQIQFRGSTLGKEGTNEIGVYLDQDKAGLQSEKLGSDEFFAVSYDTFLEDLGAVPLVSMFLEMPLFAQWESGLSRLEKLMEINVPKPIKMDFSQQMISDCMNAILFLPCKVESTESWMGLNYPSRKITYSLDENTYRILERSGVRLSEELKGATVSFILYKNNLIQIHAEAEVDSEMHRCELRIMDNAEFGKAELIYTGKSQEEVNIIKIASNRGINGLSEAWEFRRGEEHKSIVFSCVGDKSVVTLCSEGKEGGFTFKTTDAGLSCSTSDMLGLISLFSPGKERLSDVAVSCSITLREGSAVAVPKLKYLKEWSLEEFAGVLTILARFCGWKV